MPMKTLRENPILIAVGILVVCAAAAHIYFNTDLLTRLEPQESPQARRDRIINEQRKQVVDDRGYFTLMLPQSWTTLSGESTGTTRSSLVATTADFTTNEEGAVTAGASFEISARAGAPAGLPTLNLLESFSTRLGDTTVPVSVYRSADGSGLSLITHIPNESIYYEITMRYQVGSYPEGEQMFLDILRSASFTPQN